MWRSRPAPAAPSKRLVHVAHMLPATRTHTHARAHTRARTRTRTHARAHTHTNTRYTSHMPAAAIADSLGHDITHGGGSVNLRQIHAHAHYHATAVSLHRQRNGKWEQLFAIDPYCGYGMHVCVCVCMHVAQVGATFLHRPVLRLWYACMCMCMHVCMHKWEQLFSIDPYCHAGECQQFCLRAPM